jgi:hypothetical protein
MLGFCWLEFHPAPGTMIDLDAPPATLAVQAVDDARSITCRGTEKTAYVQKQRNPTNRLGNLPGFFENRVDMFSSVISLGDYYRRYLESRKMTEK